MVYGQGPLAQEVMERRRELSREIVLVMEKPDGGCVDITLIRFAAWLESQGAELGQELFLDFPDMGVQGWVRVLEIRPCPPLELPGTGRCLSQLITGTFRHSSGEVYDLKLQSESKPIGVTATHPFWSEDRKRFVSAEDLRIGETLQTWDGTTVVESFVRRPGCEPVYNLEVEGDHVYRVGDSGILVHNASAKKPDAVWTGEVNESCVKHCPQLDGSSGFSTTPSFSTIPSSTYYGRVLDENGKEIE